jgi:protein-S-isoprenylcysteine O-methyltransferase Ste14
MEEGANMSVRVSPISKMAAILIIAIGAFVLLGGFVTGDLASYVAGSAFVVLGVILYLLLIWFTRKLGRQIAEIQRNQTTGV